MARKAYIGVNGVARKITKGYIGVNGVARRIVKAYIGIGGVARPCWASGLEYYGAVTPLSEGRTNLASASIPTHAFFACGRLNSGSSLTVFSKAIDVYDRVLTRTSLSLANATPTSLNGRENLSGGSVNGVAIFGGGRHGSTEYSDYVNDVFSIDASMTVTRVPQGQYLSSNASNYATTAVGNHVIFANGTTFDSYNRIVEAYDSSLTKKTCTPTTKSIKRRAAATVGNYAIIAGGEYGNASTTYDTVIDVYDSSLTKVSSGIALSVGRSALTATTINGNALFAGGAKYQDRFNTVDSYNASLTHTTSVAPLSEARMKAEAITMKDLALFIGGETSSKTATVDAYDGSLTKTRVPQLSAGRYNHAVAKVGNFVLVGGGATDSETYASSVEAYVYS